MYPARIKYVNDSTDSFLMSVTRKLNLKEVK